MALRIDSKVSLKNMSLEPHGGTDLEAATRERRTEKGGEFEQSRAYTVQHLNRDHALTKIQSVGDSRQRYRRDPIRRPLYWSSF